jgi:hypothetical protein
VLGDIESACQNRRAPTAYLDTSLEIRSADGRLATTQPVRDGFRTDEDSIDSLYLEGEATARAAFEDQVSAPEIDWGNDFEAVFELYSRHPRGVVPSGDLQVIGFDGDWHNRLYLHWCSGEDCRTFPRPKERY